jgi:hypothetical protein
VTERRVLDGQRFHHLVAESYLPDGYYKCLCDCGKYRKVRSSELLRGNAKSCGCMTVKLRIEGNRQKREEREAEMVLTQRGKPAPKRFDPDFS